MSDEDDSPPRPKRKIKRVVVMSSSSDSDSDENIGVAGSRRKKLRILSDDEGSESSGSSVVGAGTRRRRALPQLKDSEAESDSSGWASERSGAAPAAAKASGFASDSSEGNSDKCSICLLRFTSQEVGTPESCEHIFCLDCILEWSKNVNTCPVDRMLFNSIVVRACAGGRVLRTQPVQVVERRSSVDTFVIEDLTFCEDKQTHLHRTDRRAVEDLEIDIGFFFLLCRFPHLNLQLEMCGSSEHEESMLLCDRCDLGYHMQCLTPPLTEVPPDTWLCPYCRDAHDAAIDLSEVEDIIDEFLENSPPTRPRPSALRRARDVRRSTRRRDLPSTSAGPSAAAPAPVRRAAAPAPVRRAAVRRKNKRRTKTVVVEYELQENGKFPITRRVTRKVKKRRVKRRQPRTAARRSYVRASVRARLASLGAEPRAAAALASASAPAPALAVRRQRAGIPALSLLGNPNELEYFSDDDVADADAAVGDAVAVARRPAAALAATRHARRKLGAAPSPPPAAAAPDLLQDILQRQELLHSARAVLSLGAGGRVCAQLRPAPPARRLDPAAARAPARQAPAHPGGGRAGGGGWGGGYRGTYRRDQTADFNRGGGYEAPAPRAPFGGYSTAGDARRDDATYFDAFPRRPQYASDDGYFERGRRPPAEPARPFAARPRAAEPPPARYGLAWPPYAGAPPAPRAEAPPAQARHSFGGFENPVDMRMGRTAGAQPYRRLASPPAFSFPRLAEPERSEDERSDPGLVIDTDKYDPTEPTHDDDDDSGEDDAPAAEPPPRAAPPPPPTPPPPPPPALDVPPDVLDTAVRQVLREHRGSLASPGARRSDDDSDGDCPNFSIYSATSVHIASSSSALGDLPPPSPPQRDDEPSPPLADRESPLADCAPPLANCAQPPETRAPPVDAGNKSEEEYREKVSKRCPITVNKRNPIKIKLNTPALIRRQVSLYDEEEASLEADVAPDASDARAPSPLAADAAPQSEEPERQENEAESKGSSDICDETEQTTNISDLKEQSDDSQDKEENGKEASPQISPPPAEESSELPEPDEHEDEEEKVHIEKEEENNNENVTHEGTESAAGERDDGGDSSEREEGSEGARGAAREGGGGAAGKMTESISETEDERSYTPCLDEQRPAEDTELISDTDDLFPEPAHAPAPEPAPAPAPEPEPGTPRRRDAKKKKKKESKRPKRKDVAFKKLSKSGKERHYRERDKDDEREREREQDGDARRRRRDKRKDLERYDVRSLVSEKRRKLKDAFGRDVSPEPPRRSSRSVSRVRRSPSPFRRSSSRSRKSPPRTRRSISRRRSVSRVRRSPTPPRRSPSRGRRSALGRKSPSRRGSPARARSPSPLRRRSPLRVRRSASPARRRSGTPLLSPRRRKRRRSASPAARSPPRRAPKKKKRARPARRAPPSPSPSPSPPPVRKRRRSASAAPPSPASRPPSPRTPPPERSPSPSPSPSPCRREPPRRRRAREPIGPSKEVFTSGDNILVSVSFKEQELDEEGARRRRRDTRRERRRRRRRAAAPADAPKPVAIIDLERSPFRELTPSPKNVIVLSDSEPGEREPAAPPPPAAPEPAPEPAPPAGPKTPPSPAPAAAEAAPPGAPAAAAAAAAAPSPDAYDPFEPTRSPTPPSAAPAPACASPARPHMTLEAAQRSNLSADEVLARRPLTPVEKVMALLQSTRDAEAEAGEAHAPAHASAPAPAPRIVLPSPTRAPPRLFPGKPSPIKSNPVKPMQMARLPRDDGASPYSPGSSDFGELFEPPAPRQTRARPAPAPARKRGKTQVGVKLDEDNLKILDELPSSAVELQVKSKFLKKLNRQERVVEEVKLVLKPHYNKKRVTKDEYKDILRRAVPKICHNKSGEINPTKIQALVEAYVKKFRKKHKLGVA